MEKVIVISSLENERFGVLIWQLERIPVGCVQTAAVAAMGVVYPCPLQKGHETRDLEGTCHQRYPTYPPPVSRQTHLKTLPSVAVGKNVGLKSMQQDETLDSKHR